MKRFIAFLLVSCFCVCALAACGKQEESTCTAAELYDAFLKEGNLTQEMVKMPEDYFENQFGLKVADYEEVIFAKAEDMLLAENIIIVRNKDGASNSDVIAKLEAFAKEQATIFESYVPDQAEIAKKAVVASKGQIVYLIMSSSLSDLKKVIDKTL